MSLSNCKNKVGLLVGIPLFDYMELMCIWFG